MSRRWLRDYVYSFRCCYKELYRDVKEIWNALINTPGFKEVYALFGEGIVLFREALKCYCNGAFLATLAVCRVTAETVLYYLALTGEVVIHNGVVLEKQIDNELKYLDRKRRVEPGDWELLLDKLRGKGYLTKEIEELYNKVRCRGNYVVHWGERARKKMIELVKEILNSKDINNLPKTLELWPTREEALSQLRDTQEMLSQLIEKVFEKEIKLNTQ